MYAFFCFRLGYLKGTLIELEVSLGTQTFYHQAAAINLSSTMMVYNLQAPFFFIHYCLIYRSVSTYETEHIVTDWMKIIPAVRCFHNLAHHLRAHSDEVCGLKWSDSGEYLASGGNDNLVHVWYSSKMGASSFLHRFSDHRAAIRALAWCPFQSHTLATGGGTTDQCIKIWNVQTGKCSNSINSYAQVSPVGYL